jgi:hypothetical protein
MVGIADFGQFRGCNGLRLLGNQLEGKACR